MRCPYCQATDGQVKNGCNRTGSQRWRCKRCQRKYTPEPRPIGCADPMRKRALQMVASGMSLRQVARRLGLVHQTVANWVNADAGWEADRRPAAPAAVEGDDPA